MWLGLRIVLSRRFRDNTEKRLKSKLETKLHLDRWWENRLVFWIASKKIQ